MSTCPKCGLPIGRNTPVLTQKQIVLAQMVAELLPVYHVDSAYMGEYLAKGESDYDINNATDLAKRILEACKE